MPLRDLLYAGIDPELAATLYQQQDSAPVQSPEPAPKPATTPKGTYPKGYGPTGPVASPEQKIQGPTVNVVVHEDAPQVLPASGTEGEFLFNLPKNTGPTADKDILFRRPIGSKGPLPYGVDGPPIYTNPDTNEEVYQGNIKAFTTESAFKGYLKSEPSYNPDLFPKSPEVKLEIPYFSSGLNPATEQAQAEEVPVKKPIKPEEEQAGELVKQALAEQATIKAKSPEPGYWEYLNLTNEAINKPALQTPEDIQAEQEAKIKQQELKEQEDYRLATERSITAQETPEQKALGYINAQSGPIPKQYMPSLGTLPTMLPSLIPDSQLAGFDQALETKKRRQRRK